MGGAIAQILALRHPELLRGVVLCATSSEFRSSPIMRAVWYSMSFFQLGLRLAPKWTWELFVEQIAQGDPATTAWVVGELRRGNAGGRSPRPGRDIGRFDSRSWIGDVEVPAAVLVCTMDLLVPPTMQRALAERLGAPTVEIQSDHLAPAHDPAALPPRAQRGARARRRRRVARARRACTKRLDRSA